MPRTMNDNRCPHCGMDVTQYAEIERRSKIFFAKMGRVIKALLVILAFYLLAIILLGHWGYL